jgi:hypothetical protein
MVTRVQIKQKHCDGKSAPQNGRELKQQDNSEVSEWGSKWSNDGGGRENIL